MRIAFVAGQGYFAIALPSSSNNSDLGGIGWTGLTGVVNPTIYKNPCLVRQARALPCLRKHCFLLLVGHVAAASDAIGPTRSGCDSPTARPHRTSVSGLAVRRDARVTWRYDHFERYDRSTKEASL